MSSAEGKRLRADAARNRELALEAATELLAEPGTALTVEAIAARAGLGAGTVVRAFGGKGALLDAAVSRLLEPVVRRGRELTAGGGSPLVALRTFLTELIAFQAAHHGVNEGLTGLDLPEVTALRAELVGVVRTLVGDAQAAGEVRGDIGVDTATRLIGETAFAVARSGTGTGTDELRDAYLTVLLDGLRPRRPGQGDAEGVDLSWNMGSHVPHDA